VRTICLSRANDPREICLFHAIWIDQKKRPDAQASKVFRHETANTTEANDSYTTTPKVLLAREPEHPDLSIKLK